MPLNDSSDRRQDFYGDSAMRRRPPQNNRPPRDDGFTDRQARRRKRNTLSSQAIPFKRQSLLHRIGPRTRTYIVIGLAVIAILLLIFIISSCVRSCA